MSVDLNRIESLATECREVERKVLLAKCAHSDAYAAKVIGPGQREDATRALEAAIDACESAKMALASALAPDVVIELVGMARATRPR